MEYNTPEGENNITREDRCALNRTAGSGPSTHPDEKNRCKRCNNTIEQGDQDNQLGNKMGGSKEVEGKKVIISSMDVVALYPNLDITRSAIEVGKEIEETEIEYKNIDYELGGRFIASNLTQDEIDREGLSRIVPRRKSKFGTRPSTTTKELYDKREYDREG